jgi:CO/xanthine dehydrogenase Mo-binding subunit
MIMAIQGTLAQHPTANREQLQQAIAGNLQPLPLCSLQPHPRCRHGGCNKDGRAVAMAKVEMPEHVLQVGKAQLEAWGPSETLQVVGKAPPKRSGFDKVTGRVCYAFDVQLPGMLYGAIVRSTEARTRVVAIDTNEATKIPRVRTILTPQKIYERGSLRQGEADAVYEQRYATEVQHHNPLEPHGCVASWQGQELVLWDSNQGVHMVKDGLAQALGLSINHIRVINEHTGGGFGSKNGLKPYHIIAAVLSQRSGRPVRLFMNREEFIASHHRAKSRHIIRVGVKQDGTLTSLYHRIIGQAGPDPEGIRLAVAGADCTKHLYQCPHMKIELYKVLTNTQSPIPCRGPTAAEDLFCFEQFIDELAHMLKIEPLAFRLQNYAEIDPVDNRPYSSKWLKACYEQGAKAFGWEWRPPRTVREGSKYRGIGLGSQADEFPLATVALAARVQAGTCIDCRVVLGGVAPRPYRATAAEEAIKGSPLTAEQINKAAAAALADAKPMAMNTYKLDLARGLVVRAFEQVA